jgi:hypothetical protein
MDVKMRVDWGEVRHVLVKRTQKSKIESIRIRTNKCPEDEEHIKHNT